MIDSLGRRERYEFTGGGADLRWSAQQRADNSRIHYEVGLLCAIENPLERTIRYHINARGNPLSVTSPGGDVTRYHYDNPALPDRPTRIEDSSGGIRQLTWGYLGLLTQYTDCSGHSTDYQYDERGRREQSQLGDAPPIHWHSYGPGHLLGLRAGPMAVHFARNALHQETRRELYSGHAGDSHLIFQQQRQYDALGRLEHSHLQPPADNLDALNWERRYHYDAHDQLQQLQDNRHGRIGYQYDASGRLTGSLHQRPQQADQTHQYRFDAAGNRLDHGPQAGATPEDWAAKVAANLDNPHFNLLGEGSMEPPTGAPCWPDNRILTQDGEHYRYDAHGNLTERISPDGSRLQLGYDGAHRLVRLEHKKANGEHWLADYRYDPLSRRISKQVQYTDAHGQQHPTKTTCYGWDGDQQSAEAWQDQDGQWHIRTTLYEPGSFVPLLRMDQTQTDPDPMLLELKRQLAEAGEPMPEALREALAEEAGECRFASYHTDHLGTPLALTDEQGKVLWEARPDDWAAVSDPQGSTSQPIRYQGQYEDEESGLYYNRHRYYDPQLGRYVNQDPIGLLGGMNAYAYPHAPTGWVDPLGLNGVTLTHENAKNSIKDRIKEEAKGKAKEEIRGFLEDEGIMTPQQICHLEHCSRAGVMHSVCMIEHCADELGLGAQPKKIKQPQEKQESLDVDYLEDLHRRITDERRERDRLLK